MPLTQFVRPSVTPRHLVLTTQPTEHLLFESIYLCTLNKAQVRYLSYAYFRNNLPFFFLSHFL
jgi:hypothetical protein